jgi:hypothetical protein
VTKLGGNKADPYNLSKGSWKRRFMILQDDLKYEALQRLESLKLQPQDAVGG